MVIGVPNGAQLMGKINFVSFRAAMLLECLSMVRAHDDEPSTSTSGWVGRVRKFGTGC